jgi:REP element-mobilizing transposase RayT
MSTKYKFTDKAATYFTTSTIVGWINVFTRDLYRDILLNNFRYCQKNQGLQLHAWVLMTNHFHLIYSCSSDHDPATVLKNIKSYTALKIIDAIIRNPKESRKECLPAGEAGMLKMFRQYGEENKSNYQYQFWQHENHPILLDSTGMLEQRITYLHENPVRAGFVELAESWKYSSAADYYTKDKKGLLEIISVY